MPRRRFIDPKTSTTFAVVNRPQNDPLIHDDSAPSHVFAEKQSRRPTDSDYAYSAYSGSQSNAGYRSKKTKQRGDLEDEFGLNVRKNEGEAAEHGVFFDDSDYDYMQHMRDLGEGQGAATWVEASAPTQQQRKQGKGKQRLEDALAGLEMDDGRSVGGESMGIQSSAAKSLLPEEVLPSEFVRKRTYQDQQDVPDEIAGFQPDMDPRLREVLEALEDEEYVDDDEGEDDFFGELTQDGYEVERDEWERLGEQQLFDDGEGSLDFAGEDDDGWESDDTIKASSPPPSTAIPVDLQLPSGDLTQPPEDAQAVPPADPTAGAWLDEFKKFKSEAKASKESNTKDAAPVRAPSALESSALSSLATGRRKKRKGAKTETTNYSMTSSALARTDQQSLLDSRFDKIEEEYAAEELPDDDEALDDALSMASGASKASHLSKYSAMSGMSGVSGISSYTRATDSEAPQLQRSDFDGIMDDFLGGYSKKGKLGKRVKPGKPMSGMEQLDEVRQGLGPARVKSQAR